MQDIAAEYLADRTWIGVVPIRRHASQGMCFCGLTREVNLTCGPKVPQHQGHFADELYKMFLNNVRSKA
jgi:hypothetical protein